jgi:hypothetical protein
MVPLRANPVRFEERSFDRCTDLTRDFIDRPALIKELLSSVFSFAVAVLSAVR